MATFKKSYLLYALIAIVIGGVLVRYFYMQPKFINGEVAADFSTTLVDGTPFKLSDLRGKYVLLDFWGSWCGPCRIANRQVVQLYNTYHSKGLEVVSVAIEKNPEAWKRAVAADGLVWNYHICDFNYFDSEIPKFYSVHEIPTSYLISPEGMILGVNLTDDLVRKILESKGIKRQ
jgi:thiol-disulfide isomerase/thioredoxin